jgi:hypothetical protein
MDEPDLGILSLSSRDSSPSNPGIIVPDQNRETGTPLPLTVAENYPNYENLLENAKTKERRKGLERRCWQDSPL